MTTVTGDQVTGDKAKTTRICGGNIFKGPGPVARCRAAEEEQGTRMYSHGNSKTTRTRVYSHGTAKQQEYIYMEQQNNKNKNVFTWEQQKKKNKNENIFTWNSKTTRTRVYSHGTAKQQEYIHMEQQNNKNKSVFT